MGITPNFTMVDIQKRFDAFIDTVEKRQIQRLQYLGEQCVKIARELPADKGFTDQTGNLRSSIGYIVFRNGVAIHEGYDQIKGGSKGAQQGASLARSVGAKYTKGISLVVTAGMSYAVAVESRGKDVLTSAEIYAKQNLPKMLNELKININKSFAAL